MERPERVQLFDRWAQHYDTSVPGRDNFPHDGYEKVLKLVAATASVRLGMTILDLGIYWAADETAEACSHEGLDVSYVQVSSGSALLPAGPPGAGRQSRTG
jgi:hypothetical protein